MNELFFSNRLESLYERLKANLFFSKPPRLATRLVFTPSDLLTTYLKEKMGVDPSLRGMVGVKILPFSEGLSLLLQRFPLKKKQSFPSRIQIRFALEDFIRKSLDQLDSPYEELLSACRRGGESYLLSLCERLASLFAEYGVYGEKALPLWIEGQGGWQERLFVSLFQERNWSFPCLGLQVKGAAFIKEGDVEVHCFGFSFLPPVYLDFLMNVGKQIRVVHYQHSPTLHFWIDQRSSYEIYRKKGGVGQPEDQNPLLANLGVLGRRYLEQLDSYDTLLDEDYEVEEDPRTFLSHIQKDLLLLEPKTEIRSFQKDGSLRIFGVPSKLREVEVLRENIRALFAEGSLITPADVVVYAPSMEEYRPHIELVFASFKELPISFDVAPPPKSISALLQLLALHVSKWSVKEVKALFASPSFQKKQGISEQEVEVLSDWFGALRVRFGMNSAHKETLLGEGGEEGTWEEVEKRLLGSLIYSKEVRRDLETESAYNSLSPLALFPLDRVGLSDLSLIEKFLDLMADLRVDIDSIRSLKTTLGDWVVKIHTFSKSYLLLDAEDEKALASLTWPLVLASREVADSLFDFSSIERELKKELASPGGDKLSIAARFVSLKEGALYPAKCIYILGFDEESFPKRGLRDSLHLLLSENFCPSNSLKDRYLFLELLLSSRGFFYMSYQHVDPQEAKKKNPSILLKELFSYLDERYLILNEERALQLPSTALFTVSPLFAFDKSYFSKDAPLPSYDSQGYTLAQIHYQMKPCKAPIEQLPQSINFEEVFVEEFLRSKLPDQIDLASLMSFAKNPLKFFFRRIKKIDLEQDRWDERQEESDLLLSPLDLYQLRARIWTKGVSNAFRELKKSRKAPLGVFEKLAHHLLLEEDQERITALKGFDLIPDEIETLFLQHAIPEKQKPYTRILAPLKIDILGREIEVVGKLGPVARLGLVIDAKEQKEQAIAHWPELLVLANLYPTSKVPPQLLFLEDRKIRCFEFVDPRRSLIDYLYYFLLAHEEPSLLLPSLAKAFLGEEASEIRSLIEKMNRGDYGFSDPYLGLFSSLENSGDVSFLHTRWQPLFHKLFSPLIREYSV